MKRPRTIIALAVIAIGAFALFAYQRQDYRPRFARAAGELVAVRDSTDVANLPDGSRITQVTLVSDNGFTARARVRSPGLQDGIRRPTVILLGGYKNGMAVVEVPETTRGLVLASVEYPYGAEDRPRGLAWLWRFPAVRNALVESPPAVLLLAQYLYTREDVDPDRVTIVGASLGVPFGVAAAATDRRIAGVALAHGGGDIALMLRASLAEDLPAWAVTPVARFAALALAPLEPTRYVGAIAPRPLLMLNARQDETIPHASPLALYGAARQPKRIVWLSSQHVSLTEEEVIRELLDEIVAWMRERGLA